MDFQSSSGRKLSFPNVQFLEGRDLNEILKAFANSLVPRFADWCMVHLTSQTVRRPQEQGIVIHKDDAKTIFGEAFMHHFPLVTGRSASWGPHHVFNTGVSELLTSVPQRPTSSDDPLTFEFWSLLGKFSASSCICVPLKSRGRTLGTLALGTVGESQSFSDTDLDCAESMALTIALAIDNSDLLVEAQRASSLKDEFLSVLFHELRTPLNVIVGHAELLKEELKDNEAIQPSVDAISRNVSLQSRIISDLLDASAITLGQIRLEPRLVSPIQIAEQAIEKMHYTAEAKGIRLNWDFNNAPSTIMADERRLGQVLWQLISNAIKFTPEGGIVSISCESVDGNCIYRIEDTGRGIEPGFIPYVFDRFRQEDCGLTRRYGGLGVGMYIARHLIELHGGTVQVESSGRGLGARFVVTVPIGLISSTAQDYEADAAKRPDPVRNLKVLVVDDEADTRMVLRMILARAGADVRTADSAHEALNLFHQEKPDLVISDIAMPEEDGYELIKKIREEELDMGDFTPAIALTSYAEMGERKKALAAGYQIHISKPVLPSEFFKVIDDVMSPHRFGFQLL